MSLSPATTKHRLYFVYNGSNDILALLIIETHFCAYCFRADGEVALQIQKRGQLLHVIVERYRQHKFLKQDLRWGLSFIPRELSLTELIQSLRCSDNHMCRWLRMRSVPSWPIITVMLMLTCAPTYGGLITAICTCKVSLHTSTETARFFNKNPCGNSCP